MWQVRNDFKPFDTASDNCRIEFFFEASNTNQNYPFFSYYELSNYSFITKEIELNNSLITIRIYLILIFFLLISYKASADDIKTKITKLLYKSEQLIVVISENWDAPTAVMTCLEKKGDRFFKIGEDLEVFIGKSGLGWGRGLIEFEKNNGPIKREGDKKAPAGIFSLLYVFGLLPPDSLSWLKYTYKQISNKNECVDDTSSKFYNNIVNTLAIEKNWKSSENMDDPDYKYGIVINHNSTPVEKGCGSCIFFHLTGPKPKPTAGCTAMDEKSFISFLKWLDEKKNPILMQLPKSEFEKLELKNID